MRLLLDSQVWLWWHLDPKRLSPGARRLLEDGRQAIFFSAASALEMSLKAGIAPDRLQLPEPLSSFLPRTLKEDGFDVLPVDITHAVRLGELPRHHPDPFDRLLVAQAQVEQLAILSADAQLMSYDVEVVWAGRTAPRRKAGRSRKKAVRRKGRQTRTGRR